MDFPISDNIRDFDLIRTDSDYGAKSMVEVVNVMDSASTEDVVFEDGVRVP